MWSKRTFILSWAGICLSAPAAIIHHMLGYYRESTFLWEIVALGVVGGMYASWIIQQERSKPRG